MKTYEVRGHGVSGNPITRKFTSRMRAVQAAKLSLSYNGFCPVSRRWDDGKTAVYRDRSDLARDQTGERAAYVVCEVRGEA